MASKSTTYLVFSIWILFLDQGIASAQNKSCSTLTTAQNVLDCALERHPKIQRAKAQFEEAAAQEEQASQFPNPEFDSKALTGSTLGDQILEVELSLLQPISIGGKRGSLMDRAVAEKERGGANLRGAEEEVTVETILLLNRLRQIEQESAIVNEALHTFSTVSAQFASRPRLNPDQQVSYGIFQLAYNDYKLRQSSLVTATTQARKNLETILGDRNVDPKTVSLAPPTNWPEIPNTLPENTRPQDSQTKNAEAELLIAQADHEISKSDSWPEVKIGPVVGYRAEGGVNEFTYGAGLSFPLPVLSQNGGARAVTLKGIQRAEVNMNLTLLEKKAEYDVLKTQYDSAVKALKESVSASSIEGKHQNIERLFKQGLIGGPAVVEAHRQIYEFATHKHEQELQALEALWKIYALRGTISKEKL